MPNVLPDRVSRCGAFSAVEAAPDLATPNIMLRLDRAFCGVDGTINVVRHSVDGGLVETSLRSPAFSCAKPDHPALSIRAAPPCNENREKLCRKRSRSRPSGYLVIIKILLSSDSSSKGIVSAAPVYAWIACCTCGYTAIMRW
jgi:hypothetical protein